MFRFFSRLRRQPPRPNVARIRLTPKRNLDRTVFGLAIGLSLITSVPQDISRRFDKPFFIPLGFARETKASRDNQIAFTAEDLETQRKVYGDKELRNKIKSTVASRLVAAQNAPPSVAFNKQCKFNFTWLFIKYPSRPPPEFERFCLKITGDETTLVTQPVSPTDLYRMRVIFNPLIVFQAVLRAYDATFPAGGVVGFNSEPAGLRFIANLVIEMRKEWKPPSFIPRNHVVVEGLVELVGNGNLAVVEVDMSIDPNNLKDVIWRSAVIKYSGKWDNKSQVVRLGQDMSSFDWTHTLELRKKMMEKKREAANREKQFQNNEIRLKEMEKERERKAEEEKQQEAALKEKEEEVQDGMVQVTPDGPKLYVPAPLPDHYETTTNGADDAAKAEQTSADSTAENKKEQTPSPHSQRQEAHPDTTNKETISKKPTVEHQSNTPEESTEKKADSEEQQSIAKNGRAD